MSLPTKHRIRRPAEFRRVFSRGRRTSNALANVVVLPNELAYSRVGLSVSKRVGNAVTRNLVKRRVRNVFANITSTEGWDIVVTAKPESADANFADLERALTKSIQRAGIEIVSADSKVVV